MELVQLRNRFFNLIKLNLQNQHTDNGYYIGQCSSMAWGMEERIIRPCSVGEETRSRVDEIQDYEPLWS